MEDENKDSKYREHTLLCKWISEEAKALSDYLCRSESVDEASSDLFLHLAWEEAKHLAMLISKLASMYKPLEEHLIKFQIDPNPVKLEDD